MSEKYTIENSPKGFNLEQIILHNLLIDIKNEDFDNPEFKWDYASAIRYVLVDGVLDKTDQAIIKKLEAIEKEEQDRLGDEDYVAGTKNSYKNRKYKLASFIDNLDLKNKAVDLLDEYYYIKFWNDYDYSISFEKDVINVMWDYSTKLNQDIKNNIEPIRNDDVRKGLLSNVINNALGYIEENSDKFSLENLGNLLTTDANFSSEDKAYDILNTKIYKMVEELSMEDIKELDYKKLLVDIFNHISDEEKRGEVLDLLEKKFLDYMFINIDEGFNDIKGKFYILKSYTSDHFNFVCEKYLKDFCMYSTLEGKSTNEQYLYLSTEEVEEIALSILYNFKAERDRDILHFINNSEMPIIYDSVADILKNGFNKYSPKHIEDEYEKENEELKGLLSPYRNADVAISLMKRSLIDRLVKNNRFMNGEGEDLFIEIVQEAKGNSFHELIMFVEDQMLTLEDKKLREIYKDTIDGGKEVKNYEILYCYNDRDSLMNKEFDKAEDGNLLSDNKIAEVKAKGGSSIAD